VKFSQKRCYNKNTKSNCHRKRCCTVGTKGKIIRKVECHWDSDEKCTEIKFSKCHYKKKNLQLKIYIKIVKEENVVCIQKLEL